MRPILLLVAVLPLVAQSPTPLSSDATGVYAIWPGVPPGSENWTWRRQMSDRGGSRMVRNVVTPSITMYRPQAGKANGASVIIAPGGAFRFLMVDYEGVDLARWLTARGVTAFVLEYRLMHTPEDEPGMAAYLDQLNRSYAARDTKGENPPKYDDTVLAAIKIAEEDGRQAIRYVRQHAAEWLLDPRRIGIVGFSAGGAVVMGAVMWHDAASRPDFAAPIYPTYRSVTPVPDDAPPLFIAIADDDKLISPSSSARIFMAWHAAGKSAEFHVFRQGGHGFGMKTQNRPSDGWLQLFHSWMNSLGLLNAAISRLYVFGDSYSDTGAGYVDGDGPTAVAYLASRLGLKLMTPSAPDANSHSLNFAVSGAQTGRGAGRKVKDSLLGYGMANQVEDFVARAQSGSLKFDP